MEKTVNVTIRLSPDLKAEAEIAASYLDTTLSRAVRAALEGLVSTAQSVCARRALVAQIELAS